MKDFLTDDQIIKIGNSGLYMFKYGNKKYTAQELKKFLNEREKELQESLKDEDKPKTKSTNRRNKTEEPTTD